jgi:hypothetical protein
MIKKEGVETETVGDLLKGYIRILVGHAGKLQVGIGKIIRNYWQWRL